MCCSLIQGKCQMQEVVFKYPCIQRLFFCNFLLSSQICHRAFQIEANVCERLASPLTRAADVSRVLMAQCPGMHTLL